MKRMLLPLAAALLLLSACHQETPEFQVKRAFADCVAAVEAGDAAPVVKALAPAFSGPEGLDRDGAKLFLLATLRQGKIGVTVLSQRIAVQGNRAEQSVDLVFTRRGGASILPDETTRRTFVLRWEKRGGDWKLREAQVLEP